MKKKPKLFGKSGAKKAPKSMDAFVSGSTKDKGPPSKRVMMYFDTELHRRAKVWCAENGRSLSSIAEEAIGKFLDGQK